MNKGVIAATAEARRYLAEVDAVMGGLIERYGIIEYPLAADYFSALLSNIVGQQLSNRVADVIWQRIVNLLGGNITAVGVLGLDDEQLRAAGLSRNKIAYVKNIARAAESRTLTFDKYAEMSGDAVKRQLTALRGIGDWTAEMFLIFSLGKMDVFSAGDGGLARAIDRLYGDGSEVSVRERIALAEKWSPFRSIACLYLWKSL